MKTSEIVKEIIEIFVKPKRQKQHIQEIIGDLSKGEVGILAYLLNETKSIKRLLRRLFSLPKQPNHVQSLIQELA